MLVLKGLSDGLRGLFLNELERLIERFTKITQEDQENIQQVTEILERLEIEEKYNTDLEELMQLSSFLKEYSVQTVEFFLWYRYGIGNEITVQEADEYILKIEACGYVEIDGMLIYEDGAYLDEYVEKLIKEEFLTDVYHVKRLIDIDEIIEMWMEGVPISKMEDELKHLDLNELLDNPIEEAYITADNKVMMYVELDL